VRVVCNLTHQATQQPDNQVGETLSQKSGLVNDILELKGYWRKPLLWFGSGLSVPQGPHGRSMSLRGQCREVRDLRDGALGLPKSRRQWW
jgi:hypothetical protein